MGWSKKCSFMPAKAKDLKWGAEDDEGPKQVASPDLKGLPSHTDRGEVGEGDNMQSMMVEDLTARVEVLLKHTEETWGNNPSPELAQCAILMHWAVSGVSATVEEEGNLSKLEVAVAVGKMHIHEACHAQQQWVDITAYAEAAREIAREKHGLEGEE
jgi:hypothetical protein